MQRPSNQDEVTSSRDGQKFQEQMATALADENNAQLDVVLNSLRVRAAFTFGIAFARLHSDLRNREPPEPRS